MKALAIGISGLVMILLLSPGFMGAQSNAFSGEIMDSQCAKTGSHEGMVDYKTARDCTLGCVQMGAKFVLYDPDSRITYQLDDQKRPARFAGEKVTVMGTYDS